MKNGTAAAAVRAIKGSIIGIGAVLPGVSGGVMAMSLGVYEPAVEALARLRKNFKAAVAFLLPLAVGVAAGVLLGSTVLEMLMERFAQQVTLLFIGLVAGSVPEFVAQANRDGFKKRYLILLGLGMLAAALLAMVDGAQTGPAEQLLPWQYVVSGAVLAAGSIIPGISTSMIMLQLGWYQPFLAAISAMDAAAMACIALGAVACAVLTLWAVRQIFLRVHGPACWFVLGFLVVSMALVFPPLGAEGLLLNIVLLVGCAAGYGMTLLGRRIGEN